MGCYSVTDVANFFIDYYNRSVDPVNLSRVQMFVYYAQAESLCRNGYPLFEDEVRAYPLGPAVTRLNVYFEEYGNRPIKPSATYDESVFSETDLKLLRDVAIFYNEFSTSKLQMMAFSQGGPWETVYSAAGNQAVIDNGLIRDFYIQQERVPDHRKFLFEEIGRSCGICTAPACPEQDESTAVYSENESSQTWE